MYMYVIVKSSLQVFESSARAKFELSSAPFLGVPFSLPAEGSFNFFFASVLAVMGTHLKIFIVVSPIVTHFFSLQS